MKEGFKWCIHILILYLDYFILILIIKEPEKGHGRERELSKGMPLQLFS